MTDLADTVYGQEGVSGAIGTILDRVSDDVREEAATILSHLIDQIIALTRSDPHLPNAAIWDPASSVWQNGTDAFIRRNRAEIDHLVDEHKNSLQGWILEDLLQLLMQLVHAVALNTMLTMAILEYGQPGE